MSLYSPNFSLSGSWQKTFSSMYQVLRRVRFVVENTFSFGDFDPQLDFGVMTAASVVVNRARYIKILNMLWWSLDCSATLSGSFTLRVYVTIPGTGESLGQINTQVVHALVRNGGTYEAGHCHLVSGENRMSIFRGALGNYSAGAWSCTANGFFEVM